MITLYYDMLSKFSGIAELVLKSQLTQIN